MIRAGLFLADRVFRKSLVIKFASVGVITTFLDLVLFAALTSYAQFSTVPANIVSYGSGVALSFVLNRWWTFQGAQGTSSVLQDAGKFIFSNAAGLLLSTVLVFALSHLLNSLMAKIISVPIVFIWNFLLAKYWVFNSRDQS